MRGYKNVRLYQEGLETWVKAGYPLAVLEAIPKASVEMLPPEKVKALLAQDPGIILLDIRDADLYDVIRFKPDATTHILIVDFLEKFGTLPKNRKIIVVDHLGKQAVSAAAFLKGKGFSIEGILDGGITAWQKAGYPMQ
jgi:rhodanese-related sulfurtransferase